MSYNKNFTKGCHVGKLEPQAAKLSDLIGNPTVSLNLKNLIIVEQEAIKILKQWVWFRKKTVGFMLASEIYEKKIKKKFTKYFKFNKTFEIKIIYFCL